MAQKLNHKERRPLEEIQQYRENGTVERCREAVEKQTVKKIENWNGQTSCPNCKVLYGNMSEIKLKSCPFCGGEAEMVEDTNHISFVRCKQRCCRTYFFESPKVASMAWNRRAGEQNE